MPDATTYGLFVAAALALLVVPGPAIFYSLARGVEGGRPAGIVSCLGIQIGTLLHATLAAAGLSAVVASSATAFSVVKWVGAAYLVYLGLKNLFGREQAAEDVEVEREPLRRVFVQAVLVQVLNPKVALFFLAFLPQFVDPSRGPVWTQTLILGATLAALGLFTDGFFAVLGGTAGTWLKSRGTGLRRAGRYVSGGVYLALGAVSAATGSGKD
jgi:threonine/homoserine/homoserine lactone efflux protein